MWRLCFISEGISHPVLYGDLVYKLRRVKFEANFVVSSGSKIVKRLRRRKYDPVVIERTIGLVLDPSTALYRSFLKHCTLTYRSFGDVFMLSQCVWDFSVGEGAFVIKKLK